MLNGIYNDGLIIRVGTAVIKTDMSSEEFFRVKDKVIICSMNSEKLSLMLISVKLFYQTIT